LIFIWTEERKKLLAIIYRLQITKNPTQELWIKFAFGIKAFSFEFVQLRLMNFKTGLLMFDQLALF